jgi:hypothetical protein
MYKRTSWVQETRHKIRAPSLKSGTSDMFSSVSTRVYPPPSTSCLNPKYKASYLDHEFRYEPGFYTLFADDTTLLLSNPDINLLMQEANAEFHKLKLFSIT